MQLGGGLLRNYDHVLALPENAVRHSWARLIRRAGVTDVRSHDMRHEAIRCFFEMGLSIPEVALITGHKDLGVLARYTHLKAERVMKRLGKF